MRRTQSGMHRQVPMKSCSKAKQWLADCVVLAINQNAEWCQ
ncbi:hypothetical protein SynA1528_02750 [Synechococcus sp. A15-28]|nr:hypothetical protein SynA1528_02750 [Synechococcus sp. A15-28]